MPSHPRSIASRPAKGGPARRAGRALLLAGIALAFGCEQDRAPEPPSILLVVLDTLRADAVGVYGGPAGATPVLDALARQGLVYENAFAPSPWTLPSHTSLFTGLGPEDHGVGVHGRMVLPEGAATLAGHLAEAGYATASFAENALLAPGFGLHQGFDFGAARPAGMSLSEFDLIGRTREWLEQDLDVPLFVFANFFGAHAPYEIRSHNAFVPDGLAVREEELHRAGAPAGGAIAYSAGICDRLPAPHVVEVLRGLYHGDVAAVDARLGELRALLPRGGRRWVTIVTSDHGEHFGEQLLLGHEFSVRSPVLRIPLVVHGLPGVVPARLAQPVRLADITASILDWAGVSRATPGAITGRPLPISAAEPAAERAMLAVFTDSPPRMPENYTVESDLVRGKRFGCRHEHRVHGDTWALMRYPHKLIAFERHPAELYDLGWDPDERSDRARYEVGRRDALASELETLRTSTLLARPDSVPELAPAQLDALEALGYTE